MCLMTGTTTLILVICLTLITLACLTGTIFLVWWTMGSSGQHSISAAKHQERILEASREMTREASRVVEIQAKLTETLLLGRPIPVTQPELEPAKPPEISLTPDDLWNQLPDTIRANLLREAEEEGTWQSPSEMLQPPSPNGTAAATSDQYTT